MIFAVVGGLCLLYFVFILVYAGASSSFAWFWLAAGIACGAVQAVKTLAGKIPGKTPPLWLTVGFWTTVGIGAALALVVETLVVIGMFSHTDPAKLDYLIVLGAHIEGEQPSRSLRYRLDRAIEYLEQDGDVTVIVSGGQGLNEDVTEAYAMARYLMNHGVDPGRIQLESHSVNTRENLIFSYEIIGDPHAAVGIVTNSFHVFRTVSLADRLGYDGAVGIAAPSDKLLLPSYMVREFFAVMKEKIMGYI